MIFDTFKLQQLELSNRIVMAPLTRTRSQNGIPNQMNVEYYRQRASVGLIISEGTAISPTSMGYLNIPGLFNAAQIKGWQKVTQAVHEEGGKIFAQLWHVGRISHVSNQPNYFQPLAPSDIQAQNSFPWGVMDGKQGRVPASKPRAMLLEEIQETISDYAKAAKNAMISKFDGIEIHAANGYLLDQFLNPNTNIRTDEYGGSIVNRCRMVLDVVDAISNEIGSERVGIRFSPYGTQHDMPLFNELSETFEYLASELERRNIAYIHLNDQGKIFKEHYEFMEKMRNNFSSCIIFAGQLKKDIATELISSGIIDLAAFGRLMISNPDLVERFKNNWELNPGKPELYYGSTAEGYIDYPKYESS